MTNKSGLLNRWRQFEAQCPEEAAALQKVIDEVYEKLHEKKSPICGDIEQLRKLVDMECARKVLLIKNTSDQGLAAWALTMGMIFLTEAVSKHGT